MKTAQALDAAPGLAWDKRLRFRLGLCRMFSTRVPEWRW
jgi:hypothetical protein